MQHDNDMFFLSKVCRYGFVRHLEQLIYYGADLNAQNGSGNTPLHICSLYNQVKDRSSQTNIVGPSMQAAFINACVRKRNGKE